MVTGQECPQISSVPLKASDICQNHTATTKSSAGRDIKEDNTSIAIFWLLLKQCDHRETSQSLKATFKLPSPQNPYSFTNPYSHNLKLCASFLGFVTETEMGTEKSQFSKKSAFIIPQGQYHANGMCVMKLIKPLVFCLLCSFVQSSGAPHFCQFCF